MKALCKVCLVLFGVATVTACSQLEVWERGNLSRPEMSWEPDALEASLQQHIHFSKEASSGGASAAGGGCGCN